MRVLMVFSTGIPVCDGIAAHVVGLAKRLKSRGHNILLMVRGNWHGFSEFDYEGFHVTKVPFYPLYPFHVYLHGLFLRKAVESLAQKPDIIHLHSPLVPPLPKNWPILTTFHTPMLVDTAHVESIGLKTSLIKLMGRTTSYWIEKKLLNISDAIITVSQAVADELLSYYGFSGDNLYIIPNVVDIEYYKPIQHSFFPNEKKLLYVGRLGYRKGLFEIVKSAKYVVEKHTDVRYVIVGSGPLEKDLRKLIFKLGLTEYFELHGEIRDPSRILRFYHEAQAVLIPSYYEGAPIVMLEAMASGKAIITTATDFAKRLIENGMNGILVTPKSVNELADATIELLSSKELCNKLGEAARKTALDKIDGDANTDRVEEVYGYALKKFRNAHGISRG